MSPGRYRHRAARAAPLQLHSPGCLRNSAKVAVTGLLAQLRLSCNRVACANGNWTNASGAAQVARCLDYTANPLRNI